MPAACRRGRTLPWADGPNIRGPFTMTPRRTSSPAALIGREDAVTTRSPGSAGAARSAVRLGGIGTFQFSAWQASRGGDVRCHGVPTSAAEPAGRLLRVLVPNHQGTRSKPAHGGAEGGRHPSRDTAGVALVRVVG